MNVGLVGWRGMVGSVLMQRMQQEGDFDLIEPVFFSTSNAGGNAPSFAKNETKLKDATSIDDLKKCEAIISCQGGDYTNEVFPKLRAAGWNGYWIDAASSLRMKDDAVIILDPVNLDVIKNALVKGQQELHRRQLHGQPDADGARRPVPRKPRRLDDGHDVSGRIGRGRAEHARTAAANGHAVRCGEGRPGGSVVGDSRHRPPRAERDEQRRACRPTTSACRSPAR